MKLFSNFPQQHKMGKINGLNKESVGSFLHSKISFFALNAAP